MPFTPVDADFERRTREAYGRQGAMRLIGATLVHVAPGTVEIALPYRAEIAQQHGFLHGGIMAASLDSACGFAAFSLMPPDGEPLTIEFKQEMLAPGIGDRFVAIGRVRKAGRSVSFCEAEGHAYTGTTAKLVARTTATMMTVTGRASVRQRD